MNLLERVHERFVTGRRVAVLGGLLVREIPRGTCVLEVGAGSGELLGWIAKERPDVEVRGLDVLVRPGSALPIGAFDGRTIPLEPSSVDLVLFVDVLHHTEDPRRLLAEAKRVARRHVLIKDHLREGLAANATLRFMDRVGNARFGVALPYNYWRREQWLAAFEELDLGVEVWRDRLQLYPWPASLAFNRSLHFLARLTV